MIKESENVELTNKQITEWAVTIKNNHDKKRINFDYYKGIHRILDRNKKEPNNKLVINLAKYISVMATNYLVGNAVEYQYDEDQGKQTYDKLQELFTRNNISDIDIADAKQSSIGGRAYEITYMSNDENPIPKTATLDFYNEYVDIVVDDTVEHNCLYGIRMFQLSNSHWQLELFDNQNISIYELDASFNVLGLKNVVEHYFDRVPITMILNNDEEQGDFEQVLDAIDAYEKIYAEQLNDIDNFNDAILLLFKTGLLTGTEEEVKKRIDYLKQERILEFDSDGQNAGWLTKILDQGKINVLAKSLREDIHSVTFVPNLTDDAFANNTSGVAMQYKLIGFDALIMEKQKKFERALRRRLKLYVSALTKLGYEELDVSKIKITFHRALPRNDLEMSQIISLIDGRNIIDKTTLAQQLSFYDADKVQQGLEKDKENEPATIDYASIMNSTSFGGG